MFNKHLSYSSLKRTEIRLFTTILSSNSLPICFNLRPRWIRRMPSCGFYVLLIPTMESPAAWRCVFVVLFREEWIWQIHLELLGRYVFQPNVFSLLIWFFSVFSCLTATVNQVKTHHFASFLMYMLHLSLRRSWWTHKNQKTMRDSFPDSLYK